MAWTLNQYAAPFIPIAYRQVEDFSEEWWELVKLPWFSDFWVREYFDEEELEGLEQDEEEIEGLEQDHPEGSDIYDHLHLDSDSFFHSYKDALRAVERAKNSSERMELMFRTIN